MEGVLVVEWDGVCVDLYPHIDKSKKTHTLKYENCRLNSEGNTCRIHETHSEELPRTKNSDYSFLDPVVFLVYTLCFQSKIPCLSPFHHYPWNYQNCQENCSGLFLLNSFPIDPLWNFGALLTEPASKT